jgi:hypothetical protein
MKYLQRNSNSLNSLNSPLYIQGWPKNHCKKYILEPVGKRVKYPKLVHYTRFDHYIQNTPEWNTTSDVQDNDFEPLINKILASGRVARRNVLGRFVFEDGLGRESWNMRNFIYCCYLSLFFIIKIYFYSSFLYIWGFVCVYIKLYSHFLANTL